MTTSRTPLLSIVVPVYRVEAYLADCLDSLLAEAGAEVEIVCVDDHSPDGSALIADEYARRDRRVRLLRLATNVGLGRARNAGLEQARGEYVWFVDSDDWVPAGSLPAVLDRLRASAPDVLLVDHVEVFPDGRAVPAPAASALLASVTAPVRLAERPGLLTLMHSACTKIVRREFLDEIGLRFFPGWYEDAPFAHAVLLAAGRIDALDRVCYCYRQRPAEAITKSVSARHFDVFDQYDRLWEVVERAGGGYDAFRPVLFRLMVDHLLVIAGNERRLPAGTRRDFFARLAQEYRRRLPASGYPVPGGVAGLKHRLVRHRAYPAYALLRLAWRMAPRSRRPAGPEVAVPSGRRHALATTSSGK